MTRWAILILFALSLVLVNRLEPARIIISGDNIEPLLAPVRITSTPPPSTCLTSMSTNGGASGQAVYVPCTATTASATTTSVLTSGAGGVLTWRQMSQ
jgi:hypothetical protein